MAIRNRKATETTTPSHNLVVTLTTKSDKTIRLGNLGLFENNSYHQAIAEMTEQELSQLNLSFAIEEYGIERTSIISKDDLI